MARTARDASEAAELQRLRKQAGAWLRAQREAAGMTQSELAERVGLTYYTFVSQIESGVGRVPIGVQRGWAQALGIAPAEFAKILLRHYEPELHSLLFDPPRAAAGQALSA